MRKTKIMSATLCAVLLGAMTAFHAYCDTTAAAGQTIDMSSAIVTETGTSSVSLDDRSAAAVSSDTAGAAAVSSDTIGAAAVASDTTKTAAVSSGESESGTDAASSAAAGTADVLDTTDLFSSRDLEQTADLSEARAVTVTDGETVRITSAGVYVLSGAASEAQILVEAGDEDKVQLVLDGVSITNTGAPCIYVKNADKVFVTTTDSENALSVTGTFTADGTTNTDAVIFSRDDLVLNGTGTLQITSTDNGIAGKDDLKVTGGTLQITCTADALEANDSILIADGTISISTDKDGLHAENDEDNTTGYIYICGGTLDITAGDDAIHATTIVRIDSGTIGLSAAEGIEGTYIQINDGAITIAATDDAINAGQKSDFATPTIEVNGGTVTVTMGAGDTDAIDSNGNIILNGGTLDITAQSPFDYDGTARNNGATIIVNGTQTDTITNQMMGGGMGGRGGMGGMNGRRGW